jgi:hypothetical protein
MDVRPAHPASSTLFAMQILAMQVLASFDELTLPKTISPY